jgi:hypothetical protein
VNGSDFTQFVEEVLQDLKDDNDEDPDFILYSEYSLEAEQSASDNENGFKLAAGGNDQLYNFNYCSYYSSQIINK